MFQELDVSGTWLIKPRRFEDSRGYFSETFRQSWLEEMKLPLTFQQENHSLSTEPGTIRGLHFQIGPSTQAKLVRCIRGEIFDVAVDLRVGSPTYGHSVSAILSAENGHQLLVPHGCAHAFCTLSPDSEVVYKVDRVYDRDRERAIHWQDPDLNIDWPVETSGIKVSEKDSVAPSFRDLPPYYTYKQGALFNAQCFDISGE